MKRRILVLLAALATVAALALASGCSARRSEPFAGPLPMSDPQVASGAAHFAHHCGHCHPRGERGLAPAIHNKPLPGSLIEFQVRHGLGAMPAFSEKDLGEDELDAIVAYLAALRDHEPKR